MSARRLGLVAAAITGIVLGTSGVALAATSSTQGVPIALLWTSPGDDGDEGRATDYDIRYSRYPITDKNFNLAYRYRGAPTPQVAGSLQFCIISGLLPNTDYYFAMKSADEAGNWSGMSNVAVHTGELLAAGDGHVRLMFSSPFPNPARAAASFAYALPAQGRVSVEAFDVGGRKVRTLASEERPAGPGAIVWDLTDDAGRPLQAGLYLVSARLGEASFLRRVMVVR